MTTGTAESVKSPWTGRERRSGPPDHQEYLVHRVKKGQDQRDEENLRGGFNGTAGHGGALLSFHPPGAKGKPCQRRLAMRYSFGVTPNRCLNRFTSALAVLNPERPAISWSDRSDDASSLVARSKCACQISSCRVRPVNLLKRPSRERRE